MTKRGILAYGAYVPRLRLRRETIADALAWNNPGLKAQAKGERSICAWARRDRPLSRRTPFVRI